MTDKSAQKRKEDFAKFADGAISFIDGVPESEAEISSFLDDPKKLKTTHALEAVQGSSLIKDHPEFKEFKDDEAWQKDFKAHLLKDGGKQLKSDLGELKDQLKNSREKDGSLTKQFMGWVEDRYKDDPDMFQLGATFLAGALGINPMLIELGIKVLEKNTGKLTAAREEEEAKRAAKAKKEESAADASGIKEPAGTESSQVLTAGGPQKVQGQTSITISSGTAPPVVLTIGDSAVTASKPETEINPETHAAVMQQLKTKVPAATPTVA